MSSTLNILIIVAFSALLSRPTTSTTPVYDVNVVPQHCLKGLPIESTYTPTGRTFLLNNMNVYETGDKTNKLVLIAVYDIFGFHGNTKQVIDKLAQGYGFKIVMPDYFRGQPWDYSNFPPNPQDLEDWLELFGNWDKTVKYDTIAIMNHYRNTERVTQFGIFGFCWGGKIAAQAATDFNINYLKAAGVVHPSSLSNDAAKCVQVPMYLLPSQDEPDMIPFYEVLQCKFGKNSGHRRFYDMFHGFASARGNFSNPLNRRRVDEVIQILGTFFNRNLVK